MHTSLLCLLVTIAACQAAVIPRYQAELKYDGKSGPYDLPQLPQKDSQPHKPLSYPSYPSYPFYMPYASPYYFPSLYYPMPYYGQHAVLEKDAKQGHVKAPVYDFKAPQFNFKAPAFDHKAPQYNFQAPAYDFKVPENVKPNFKLAPFAFAPYAPYAQYPSQPLKTDTQHKTPHPAPPPPIPEPKPAVHHQQEYKQEYKEVEILPEVHEVAHVEQEEKQIVHKDEPAFRSFIFIGKYEGSCQGEKDGLYYVDKKTFAYCVDQRDVFQPCPEGTENPEAEEFMNGKLQYSHHFCSVNLLAQNPEPVPTHADPHYNTYQYEEVPEEKY